VTEDELLKWVRSRINSPELALEEAARKVLDACHDMSTAVEACQKAWSGVREVELPPAKAAYVGYRLEWLEQTTTMLQMLVEAFSHVEDEVEEDAEELL
jgi:hypothetical protein